MRTINAQTRTQATSSATTKTGLASGVVMATGISAATIGLWSAACFIGALISSGPLGLIQGWFSAVAGL